MTITTRPASNLSPRALRCYRRQVSPVTSAADRSRMRQQSRLPSESLNCNLSQLRYEGCATNVHDDEEHAIYPQNFVGKRSLCLPASSAATRLTFSSLSNTWPAPLKFVPPTIAPEDKRRQEVVTPPSSTSESFRQASLCLAPVRPRPVMAPVGVQLDHQSPRQRLRNELLSMLQLPVRPLLSTSESSEESEPHTPPPPRPRQTFSCPRISPLSECDAFLLCSEAAL
mmetsp:Transcript_3089/g.6413  ORF Transcript_3089/g.6413 Transcript_3089/m.6413 type:complete len:227 (+) Transcript_3089:96-776(+)